MGLLDKNITITFHEGKVSLEDLFELLKEKLGNKYEVKFLKKGSAAAQFFGTGNAEDRIFVAKNAYHRTLITTKYAPMTDDMSREDTYLGFDRSTMKGWLKMLYSEGGWIGNGLSEPYTVAIKILIPISSTLSTANTLYNKKTKT